MDRNRNKHKIRRKARMRKSFQSVAICLGVLAFVSLSVFCVYRYAQIASLNKEIAKMEEVIQKKKADRDWLLSELEPYTNRAAIEPQAKQWLAMQPVPKETRNASASSEPNTVTIVRANAQSGGTLLGELSAMVISFLFH